MKKDIDLLVENYFSPKENVLNFETLCQLIEEQMDFTGEVKKQTIKEEKQARFSVTIPFPRLTPSEAWGRPDSQDREEINKIFKSITGGEDIRARIDSINNFLDPESAKRKRSPSLVINMMMIVEALQATLNDYSESAAGFVFEGFMAALTGGQQITGKIGGTLPIEDFVAFSQWGTDQPVSLKLLSGSTDVKGSFTNIVDFLFVRGASAIKYLVAYKKTAGDVVEKLNIFAFDITRKNFVDFIEGALGNALLAPFSSDQVRLAIQRFEEDGELATLANAITQLNGYSKRGLLHKFVATGELPSDMSPEEEEEEAARKSARIEKVYGRVELAQIRAREAEEEKMAKLEQEKIEESLQLLAEHVNQKSLTINEAFHYVEKRTLLLEASESQWAASLPQLEGLGDIIGWESYGELDLSQDNITELASIYSEILGDEINALLEETKELTNNIGTYYSAKKRSKAQGAGREAQTRTERIKKILEGDPRYSK